ncbi:MAG: hypothetical protein AB8G11_05185 [Saprospiraceae bacterium]
MKELPSNVLEEINQLIAQEENWLNQLKKSEDELENLQEVLDVYSKHSNLSEQKSVSHYQNLFNHYRIELIRDMKHHVRINLQDLRALVTRQPERYYHSYLNNLQDHSQHVNKFFKYFDKMKQEFREAISYERLRATAS